MTVARAWLARASLDDQVDAGGGAQELEVVLLRYGGVAGDAQQDELLVVDGDLPGARGIGEVGGGRERNACNGTPWAWRTNSSLVMTSASRVADLAIDGADAVGVGQKRPNGRVGGEQIPGQRRGAASRS